ncbi:hypothetical protein EOD10_33890, partial [Mesorhizobium sp. M7A.T.Ca.TU.009.01.3.2]
MRGNFKGQAASGAVPSRLLPPAGICACAQPRRSASKNAYDRRIPCAIDLAMRYVIVIAAIAFFLIW